LRGIDEIGRVSSQREQHLLFRVQGMAEDGDEISQSP
jgi:hypothetical protein